MSSQKQKQKPTTEPVPDDNDSDWEDENSGEDEVIDDKSPMNEIIKTAERTNKLLTAIMTHPKFNRDNPLASPKPLFFVADFLRRTYMEHLLPWLPKEAVFKSSRIANPYIIQYSDAKPLPTETGDEYLQQVRNWPKPTPAFLQAFEEAVGRTMMSAMIITDPVKGAMLSGGSFDWKRPVDIESIAKEILPAKSQ